MADTIIELKNITKNFGEQQVLKGIDLNIYENEFLTLLGPSGCGKTTDVYKRQKEYRVISVDAQAEALAMGNSKVFNVIILGVAAQHMDFPKEQWIEVIKNTVPAKTIDINVKAFERGYEIA